MNTLIHADIFFFVTTIVVIIVGIALTMALIYLSKVLRDIKKITGEIREETMLLRKDIDLVRKGAMSEGLKLKHIADSGLKFLLKHIKPKKGSAKTGGHKK